MWAPPYKKTISKFILQLSHISWKIWTIPPFDCVWFKVVFKIIHRLQNLVESISKIKWGWKYPHAKSVVVIIYYQFLPTTLCFTLHCRLFIWHHCPNLHYLSSSKYYQKTVAEYVWMWWSINLLEEVLQTTLFYNLYNKFLIYETNCCKSFQLYT